MTSVARGMRSASPQRPSAHEVLLVRRWRADHAALRVTLARLRLDDGVLGAIARGRIRGRTAQRSIRILHAGAACVSFVVATAAAVGVAAIVPSVDTLLLLAATIAIVVGVVTGLGAWRDVGVFPFDSLRRLAPSDAQRAARLLERVELAIALRARGVAWMASGVLATIACARSWGPAALASAPVLLAVACAMFAAGLTAGMRVATRMASARARGGASVARAVGALLRSSFTFAAALLAMRLTFVPLLDAARMAFPAPADLLDPSSWTAFVAFSETHLVAGATSLAGPFAEVSWSAVATATTITLTLGALVFAWASTPRFIDVEPASRRTDAIDVAAAALRLAGGSARYATVVARRFAAHRWVVAQHFWSRVLPAPEATMHLGVATAFATAGAEPPLATALIAMAVVLAIHVQATELRGDLAPISSLAADRDALPLMLQAPAARGVEAMMRARRTALTWQLVPSTVITTVIAAAVASAAHVPFVGVAALVATAAVTMLAAPIVQWYMGALLIVETSTERATEHGIDSAATTLQRRLQGMPRTWLVVLPLYAVVACVILASHVPPAVPAAVVALMVLSHVASIVVLRRVASAWEHRLAHRGLDARQGVG